METFTDQREDLGTENDLDDDNDEVEDLDDLDFAPSARSGPGKLTTGLLLAIVLLAAFTGGTWAQKHWSATSTGGATAAGARAGGFAGPPGGTAGGTGTGTGTGTTAGGTGTTSSTRAPAVIGTVVKVSGTTVTVKNIAGKLIKATVPAGTTVTKSSTVSLGKLASGASVTVTGTTATNGNVTATAVTTR